MEQSSAVVELVRVEQVAPPMAALFEEAYDYRHPCRGDIRQAVVLSIEADRIIVDIRAKRDAIVPESDLKRLGERELSAIDIGDEISVCVLAPHDDEGNVVVSVNLALIHQDWQRALQFSERGEVYEGTISNRNKGGLIVPFGRINGFVPASQLVSMPRYISHERKMARLSEFIGETLPLKIIEVNRHRRRLIFSERAAKREWRELQKKQLMNELYEGEVRRGIVSSLCDFGAFVDLGGADGLVHISEVAWHRVRHPSEVLSVGNELDVYILRLDYERKRIGLSIKRLQPDPWTLVDEKYHLEQLVRGTITNVVDFGAFARLEPGVEGLIHVSELANGKVGHPSDVVRKGDELTLRIISINAMRRRIGLSLRQAPQPERPAKAKEEPQPELALDDQVVSGDVQATSEMPIASEGEEAENLIPQGPMEYAPGSDGGMVLRTA